MSGGHFDYKQFWIEQIADDIQCVIDNNDNDDIDYYGDPIGKGYSEETILEMQDAVKTLKKAYVYAQRIDYLLSGDDGEDNFHRRLEKELKQCDA